MDAKPLRVTGSHTFFSDYENCPYKAYRRHVVRDLPYVESAEMAWGNLVHSGFEKAITFGQPLPDKMAHLAWFLPPIMARKPRGEWKLGIKRDGTACSFYDEAVWVKCKIDVTMMEAPKAVILDWKTGKQREDPRELEVQALLLKQKHPELQQIVGHYVWCKEVEIGDAYDLSDTSKTAQRVVGIMEHAEKALASGHFPKNENPLCGWCDVADCEFRRERRK